MEILGSRLRRGKRALAAAGSTFLVLALMAAVTALPAAATTFSNSGTITIPSGPGVSSPYPSAITVSGLTGTIVDVNATLTNISHTYPDDIDVLLVGPGGQKVVLMADTGGSSDIVNVTLAFDDAASTSLPDTTLIGAGTYKPTIGATTVGGTVGFDGTPPAPGGPYQTVLSAFNGTSPNGTWNLYVYDDAAPDSGSIAGGWSLDITTNGPTIASFNPTSGGPGASVVITGTNFTGATSVTFGGVAATFTVNSATQITATVPTTAVTGPIAVTTPNGTATSSSNFTFIPAPTVTSFTPTSGKVGTSVVITGTTFTGATAVKFNVTTATTFTVNSATQITAIVPSGATTGPVSVTTASGTGTSSSNFVVQHARTVSLNVGRKARGHVTVSDGFGACAASVPVKVQHFDKDHARWKTVGSVLTNGTGGFSSGGVEDSGRYRALAKGTTVGSGDRCLKDYSPVVRK